MSRLGRKIPKSLQECYMADSVSAELWQWAYRIEDWGRKVLVILIIIGIISTITDAIQVADVDEDLIFITIISSISLWSLYAFLEYCLYHVISLLISSLASIVENTGITSKVALYNAAKAEGINQDSEETSTKNSGSALSYFNNETSNFWKCKDCGAKNDAHSLYCKDCGKYK